MLEIFICYLCEFMWILRCLHQFIVGRKLISTKNKNKIKVNKKTSNKIVLTYLEALLEMVQWFMPTYDTHIHLFSSGKFIDPARSRTQVFFFFSSISLWSRSVNLWKNISLLIIKLYLLAFTLYLNNIPVSFPRLYCNL